MHRFIHSVLFLDINKINLIPNLKRKGVPFPFYRQKQIIRSLVPV